VCGLNGNKMKTSSNRDCDSEHDIHPALKSQLLFLCRDVYKNESKQRDSQTAIKYPSKRDKVTLGV